MIRNPLIPALVFAASVSLLAIPLHADLIGSDGFDYADGSIDGQAGGFGFDYSNFEHTTVTGSNHDGSASDWDNVTGSPTVTSGQLATTATNNAAIREYNDVEGSGAFQGAGVVYYSAYMTRTAGQAGGDNWGGISSYDFGTERLFFGVPGGQGANATFGVAQSNEAGAGTTLSSIVAQDNTTYHIVTAVDFDNNEIRMWINPDDADYDQRGTATTADVVRAYDQNNWSTAVRLGSANDAPTLWDDLAVTNTFILAAQPDRVFADDFNNADTTFVNVKSPDIGGNWSEQGTGWQVNGGAVESDGADRTAFASFTGALGDNQILVLDFETIDTTGDMFTSGYAGISLYVENDERLFIGDPGGSSSGWGLDQGGFSGVTVIADESIVGKFLYDYNSGEYEFYINGVLSLFGTADANLAFNRIRLANGSGSDIAVSELAVSFVVIPAPAALPAGLGLIALVAARRRRRAG